MVAMTFHFAECPTNRLISSRPETLDPVTQTPAYKTCPVRIERVDWVAAKLREFKAVTTKQELLAVLEKAAITGGGFACKRP